METIPTRLEALQAAVDQAGSQVAFAAICGVAQPSVWKWLHVSKQLPAEHVLAVESATGVSRHFLRPDIYPTSDWRKVKPLSQLKPITPRAPRRRRTAVSQQVAAA